MKKIFLTLMLLTSFLSGAPVKLGSDQFFNPDLLKQIKGKKIALITNHTGLDHTLEPTINHLMSHEGNYTITAIFSPEHGLTGTSRAGELVMHGKLKKIPCYSLHGKFRRPSEEMLKSIDTIIYDIQDIGSRSYTYTTTLYYVMEESAKRGIEVIILDRPNPMGGGVVDGPLLEQKQRSFVGYINTPYCHGMTVGELGLFFNGEYRIGCALKVIPMKGWKREMSFQETGLIWTPTSPQIPEKDTPFYYATTGILGDLELVNIGVGYTLPFKLVGAPWIDGDKFSEALNAQHLPGVKFAPFHFKPFFGRYRNEECQGIRIVITDPTRYRPITTGYLILGLLKSLYPQEVNMRLQKLPEAKKAMFHLINGTPKIWDILIKEPYPGWKMVAIDAAERKAFMQKREKYLLY
ncbi:exo-beta-N-acetylmuramidase NamZ domain-containing protein [Rhabdochlamydiaceae symbiont of Dictyostelium giganteum]|uniref:exo-beta-N-acetylmuramidase NamZ family protein n=1 Tax=Rhabdochlamydiaceae symbiont of Dictyostelium giganteum TaxID=3342349 RepID=UPI0038503E7D